MDDIRTIIDRCEGSNAYNLLELNTIWRTRNPEKFRQEPRVYRKLAVRCLKLGEPLLACDIIQEAREIADSSRLRQLYAEGLLQCGVYHSAITIVQQLITDAPDDFTTLTLCGHVYKEAGFASGDPSKMRHQLIKAQAFYEEAYKLAQPSARQNKPINKHTSNTIAINLATISVLLGDRRIAYRYVNEVIRAIGADGAYARDLDAQTLAMLGECHIIIEDLTQARELYQKAAAQARSELMNIISMRRRARFLLRCLGRSEYELDSIFAVPSVACITGHLVDPPGVAWSRLPATALGKLRSRIDQLIIKHKIEIGYCSGGSGGDLLFAEELLRRRGEVNLVLPFAPNHFRRALETLSGQGEWLDVFDRVLTAASSVTILADDMGTDDQAPYQYCTEIVEGLAALRARALATEQINIAIWDETDQDDLRGTAQAVQRWRGKASNTQIISCSSLVSKAMNQTKIPPIIDTVAAREKQEVTTILFADTVGFSRITDRDIPPYVEVFIGTVAKLIKTLGLQNIHKNSWGDAIFMAFEKLEDAAEFSLALCEILADIPWRQKGLPQPLTYRMALHAGPVYRLTDPITERPNYYGYHVSKGARLEPITPPGQVYTTENFAALMTARNIKGYTCDYVGRVIHPKNYGAHPIYHLKRRR